MQLFTEDSPKSSHGHFRLVPLICFGCLFIIILYYYYLFNLRCSRGKKLYSENMPVVCFYFNVVLSINKLSKFSHASLKSYLIMRVKWFLPIERQLILSWCPDILSYPSDFSTSAYSACAHQYYILFLTLNNNITFTFMHLADAFIQSDLHSGYTFFTIMCVPWELNPQPLRC